MEQIREELGGAKSRTHSVLFGLTKSSVVQKIGRGQYQLSPKAIEHHPSAPPALPGPMKAKRP
jgi:DNA-binding IclR family transcriptional regulator